MNFALILLFISAPIMAEILAIYGNDDRQDVYAVTNPQFIEMANSTAAMISQEKIKYNGTTATISEKSLADMYKLCPSERFRNQPIAATCSGTLIAPDIIMTAAHCYDLPKQACRDYRWVFDYKVSKESQSSVTVNAQNVYECEKVIFNEMNGTYDYALIKLKKSVNDRTFAPLSKAQIKVNDPLVLIGHPSGLPTKIAADAFVLQVEPTVFVSNVDAFSVNSGSGVFNASTGEVMGILVSGRMDYESKGNCSTLKVYDMKEGNESVMRVDKILEFLRKK